MMIPTPANTTSSPPAVASATPEMAEKLAINRTGRLTPAQRRLALSVGVGALMFLLCPVVLLVQMGVVLLFGDAPVSTGSGVLFTVVAAGLTILLTGLIGVNVQTFLPEAFMQQPVRVARGVLTLHKSERHRPELPFSYVIADYSFAPYVVPEEIAMRVGTPYVVYYSARSRLLLSLAALDAPDATQWEADFD